MDQVKILVKNLQMVDPSVIFLPHEAKDRVGVESDLIATAEHVHDNYDFMRKYFPQFYFNKHDTYMNSNLLMDFNTPHEECIPENFKGKIVSLWDPFYTLTEICRAKG
jgi:hypothetical protein